MLQNITNRSRVAIASGVSAVLLAPSAFAQTSTPAADAGVDAINQLASKATTYIAAAFAVAVLVAGGFWGIRMMKKSFGAAK